MPTSELIRGRNTAWFLDENTKAALIQNPKLAVVYEPVSSSIAYLGQSAIGTLASSAEWLIMRITYSVTGGVTVEFADGDSEFDNIWADRASLTYS